MKLSAGMKCLMGLPLVLTLAGNLPGMAGRQADRVEEILLKNCAMCHGGLSPEAGLRLESGEWFAAMVNVVSEEKPELKIVDPRRPQNSYLLHKVTGAGIEGRRMPLDGEPLSAADEQVIREWAMSLGPASASASGAAPRAATIRPAFWGSRLINLPTTQMLGRYRWQFLVAHRFLNPLSTGYDQFYGLNGPAAVQVNFSYGLSERLQVMVGHTNSDHQWGLGGRWLLLPGRKGAARPLALALEAGAGLVTQNFSGEKTFAAEHFKFSLQAPLSVRFSPRLSLLLVPGYSNRVNAHDEDAQGVLALGTAFKFTVFRELALIGQWLPVLDGPKAAANGWGAGLEYKVGRHVFQVFFLNAGGLFADQYHPGGDLLLKEGDFRFGFNLFRDF